MACRRRLFGVGRIGRIPSASTINNVTRLTLYAALREAVSGTSRGLTFADDGGLLSIG
jgi:hypothetical protein